MRETTPLSNKQQQPVSDSLLEVGNVGGSRRRVRDRVRLRRYQILVYTLTFIAYAMSHFSRKAYTFVKKNMRDEDGMPIMLQGRLDSIFMFSYAIGSFFSGNLGDRYSPPLVIATGLVGAGVCVLLLVFGLSQWHEQMMLNETSATDAIVTATDAPVSSSASAVASSTVFFMGVWLVHGLFQSTGGPVNTAVMGNWFAAKHRGLIFGTWTCHQYVGNIIGALCSSALLYHGIHYYWTLFIPVIANLTWALVISCLLPANPTDVDVHTNLLDQEHDDDESDGDVDAEYDYEDAHATATAVTVKATTAANANLSSTTTINHTNDNTNDSLSPPACISISAAFLIPSVPMYAMAFGFFKLTNYTIFFWLPFFLTSQQFTPAQSNLISMLYDVGMMPGGIIVGWVSDRCGGRRTLVCAVLLAMLCPLLFVFGVFADSMPVTLLLLLLGVMGILVGGPNNIITSAVAADLALHPSIRGNHRALGTVTGIINGSGSITAALGLLLVTYLQTIGWMYVWNFLIVCTVAGCLLMAPKIVEEIREIHRDRYEPIQQN